MPHRDTSKAIKQAITLALNATQGHKHSYQQAITSVLNATQGHKRSFQQAITSALNATQRHQLSYYFRSIMPHLDTIYWLSTSLLADLYPK